MRDPFADILAALGADVEVDDRPIRVDPIREARTGAPEIVYAESKRPEDVLAAMLALVEATGRAIASRVTPEIATYLGSRVPGDLHLRIEREARMAILSRPDAPIPSLAGTIAVLSAGSSDLPVAREAAIIAGEMGCEVLEAHDVGIAGLHRLVAPLRLAISRDCRAIIVAAGMDGALPAVVAGLVPVPVIGLPTSVGYGSGAPGAAALQTMLQSCAPGLMVVNVDNGIGAGIAAARISRQSCDT